MDAAELKAADSARFEDLLAQKDAKIAELEAYIRSIRAETESLRASGGSIST